MDDRELRELLTRESFLRSAAYDPEWLLDNMMGPCSVWLAETLTQAMPLEPASHVLDLGCGKAMSSVFLAREYGVSVTALDRGVEAADNERRLVDAGVRDRVQAAQGDATALELVEGTFDAMVSIDAFHYFADVEGVVASVSRSVRPGGRIGIVVPGLRDGSDRWPDRLLDHWQDGFETFHSSAWWARLWAAEPSVRSDQLTTVPWGGSDDWIAWADACDEWARRNRRVPYELEARMLRADQLGELVFVVLVATRTPPIDD
jgi:SAM-dependent methyltransferase